MAKRWSRIQTNLYSLMDPNLNFQIHCAAFRDGHAHYIGDSGRFWVTLNKDIIWDFPKQFITCHNMFNDENRSPTRSFDMGDETHNYIYSNSDISDLIREYIDTPLETLLAKSFENDLFGLTDLLKAADRRVGKKKLCKHFETHESEAARQIIQTRWPANQ